MNVPFEGYTMYPWMYPWMYTSDVYLGPRELLKIIKQGALRIRHARLWIFVNICV